MPITIFISHAREDSAHLKALEAHLALMKRQGILDAWHAELVTAGQDWRAEIDQRLLSSQIIIILVSAGYFSSDLTYHQMERAISRSREGEAKVIPVLVRPYELRGSRLTGLTSLPDNGHPVTSWTDHDAAWANVAAGVRRAMVALNGGKTLSPITAYTAVPQPPASRDHAPVSSGYVSANSVRSPMPSNPSSWAPPVSQVNPPDFRAPAAAPGYAVHGALIPQYSRVQGTRLPASRGGRSWLWSAIALVFVATSSFVGWRALPSLPSGSDEPAVVPISKRRVISQASSVPLDWGPGSAACPTPDARIILGDCKGSKDLEWLRSELSALQEKGVGCLPDLPAAFTLRSGDDEAKGIKNYYLFIYDWSGTQRVGNVWIKGGKLSITDLNTKKKFWLAYDDAGAWSTGPDPDHLKLVP